MSGLHLRFVAPLIAGVMAGPVSAADTLWAYDGFDYTLGTSLHGAGGGSGWADVWRQVDGVTSVVSGLSYTDANGRRLQTSGAAVDAGGLYGLAGRIMQDDWGTAGTSVWVSVLQTNVPVIAQGAGAGIVPGYGMQINYAMPAGLAKDSAGSMRSAITAYNTSLYASAAGSVPPSATVLHVVRYDFAVDGQKDTASLWRNPLLGQDPGTPAVSASFIDIASLLSGITLAFHTDSASTRFVFDELRIGSSFAAVTPFTSPVPEPATALLCVTGLAALGPFARRRRAPWMSFLMATVHRMGDD